MISRCPSCAAAVDENAAVCPSCHWDFAARRRLGAGHEQAAPAPPPVPPQNSLPPARSIPPLELQHFADILEEAPRPAEKPRAIEKPKAAERPKPVERPRSAERPKPVESAKPAIDPAPSPARRPYARALWALATLAACAGLGTTLWRMIPAGDGEQALPEPEAQITFPKHDDAVRVDAAKLLAGAPEPQPKPAPAPPAAAAPKPAPAPSAPAPEKPRTEAAPKSEGKPWVFRGEAFDLLTLKPVALADLTFQDSDGDDPLKATTDEKGLFSIELPPSEGGYRMTVGHPDYLPRYLDDLTPSIRLADRKMREELAKALPENEAWKGSLRRDVALIPSGN